MWQKSFYILYTKQTDIFIGTVLLFPNLHVYLQKAEFVTHKFCEICVLNPQDLHTIRISISCGLFKGGFNTWLQKKVLTIRLGILYKFTITTQRKNLVWGTLIVI